LERSGSLDGANNHTDFFHSERSPMTNHVRLLFGVLIALTFSGQILAHPGGVNAPSPDLPPIVPDGVYLSPSDVHARYSGPALEIVLTRLEHQPFAGQPPTFGPEGERHHFESEARGEVSVNGSPPQPFSLTGPVDTVALGRCPGCTTGTFDTEMLQMSLQGNTPFGPVMLRESPTLASQGVTSITDIGGGMFHIDSFFDVFTELSVDGGATWIPNSEPSSYGPDGSTRVVLGIPEPASFALVALGILGFTGCRVRRR
jgi:hypothetical protein